MQPSMRRADISRVSNFGPTPENVTYLESSFSPSSIRMVKPESAVEWCMESTICHLTQSRSSRWTQRSDKLMNGGQET